MNNRLTGLGAAAFTAVFLAFAPQAAMAQQAQGRTQAAPDTSNITDEDLNAFASAWLDVRGVAQSYQPRIAQAAQGGDKAEAQRLSQEANAQMKAAIDDNPDITVDEYREIVSAAKADSMFAQRLSSILEARAGTTTQ